MNRTLLIGCFILLINSCSKTDNNQPDVLKCDCRNYVLSPEPVICSGTICQSDTCKTYFGIWKNLFLAKNQMTAEFFNNHIFPCNTNVHKWNDGASFEISYIAKIGWAEDKLFDQFIIWLEPTTKGLYPSLDIPRNILLTESQIKSIIDLNAFSSHIFSVSPENTLKYASLDDAMKVLINASGVDTLCSKEIVFQQQPGNLVSSGHPFLIAGSPLNWEENKCIESQLDLVTGEVKVTFNACYILFCFAKETQIMLNDGLTKRIDKIKPGDKVLTVNFKTMNPEEDVVLQVDSVIHKNMVRIEFNDLTVNENTSDHPYYVKSKGWCSYKPLETKEKYNLSTKQLQIGDTCFKYEKNKLIEVQVKSIRENTGDARTYNISKLKKNKNYFANSILVSNEEQ